jgi:predicted amidophosphoribosyltransferase
MFCSKCGTQLSADAAFCSKCGAPQQGGSASSSGGEVEISRFQTKNLGTFVFTNRRIYNERQQIDIPVRNISKHQIQKGFLETPLVRIYMVGHHNDLERLFCDKSETEALNAAVGQAIAMS